MKYIFIENGQINGAGECKCLNDDIINMQVSEEIYEDFCTTPYKYIYSDGQIVVNPDFEILKSQAETATRKDELMTELNELDNKRIRAMCENSVKDEETGETWLDYYNNRIIEVRNELQTLNI